MKENDKFRRLEIKFHPSEINYYIPVNDKISAKIFFYGFEINYFRFVENQANRLTKRRIKYVFNRL